MTTASVLTDDPAVRPASSERRRKIAAALLVPDDPYGWRQAALPIIGLLAALAIASLPLPWWLAPALMILIGLLQYRVYFPLHETSHYTLFRSRRLNVAVGNICAGLLATPFSRFRAEHLEHHRAFGTADDPGGVDYFLRFRSRGEMLRFLIAPLVGASLLLKLSDYWRAEPSHGARTTKGRLPRHEIAVVLAAQAVVFAVVTGGDIGQLWRYPLFYIVPGVTVFLFLSRLRMFLEHASLDYDKFDYLAAPRLTARTIYASPVEHALLCGANFNYHHEHHAHPGVPAVHLPTYHNDYLRPEMDAEDIRMTYAEALAEIWHSLGRDERARRREHRERRTA
jgi:fatty acid desaturase